MTSEEFNRLRIDIHKVFLPGTPISDYHLFTGRQEQMSNVISAVQQPGRHVILYGERGVGKTSLSKTLVDILKDDGYRTLDTGTINCDESDNFSILWHKTFRAMYFGEEDGRRIYLNSLLPTEVVPDDIQYCLSSFPKPSIIVLDEVDQLVDAEARNLLVATLKNLSDHSVNTTIILVGVADTVDDLIQQHRSIERSLVQVRMPRMSTSEIRQIIETGFSTLNMTIEEQAKDLIVVLSQSLPYYAHSFGLYSGLRTIENKRVMVTTGDVAESTVSIITNAHNVKSAYLTAVYSPQKTNRYDAALLACALTPGDDLGFFSATDVGPAMSEIVGEKMDVTRYIHYLNEFCAEKRGSVLQAVGEVRRKRYRFVNPLMPPFVLINAYATKKLPVDIFISKAQKTEILH